MLHHQQWQEMQEVQTRACSSLSPTRAALGLCLSPEAHLSIKTMSTLQGTAHSHHLKRRTDQWSHKPVCRCLHFHGFVAVQFSPGLQATHERFSEHWIQAKQLPRKELKIHLGIELWIIWLWIRCSWTHLAHLSVFYTQKHRCSGHRNLSEAEFWHKHLFSPPSPSPTTWSFCPPSRFGILKIILLHVKKSHSFFTCAQI